MIRIMLVAIVLMCLPSGIVAAWYLGKYLGIKLLMLEDKRQQELLKDTEKFLK